MMRRWFQGLLVVALFSLLGACGSQTTIYDLVAAPQTYANQEITVQGYYLWKPDGTSVLVKGISSRPDSTDPLPVDVPVWVEGMPEDVLGKLHRPIDSAHGAVELHGRFETGGQFGPNGAYSHRLVVSQASAIETIEYQTFEAPRDVASPAISVYELEQNPDTYHNQQVTVQGFYFWTQATSGLLASGVQTELPLPGETGTGVNPKPIGTPISMEGFPPDLSAKLNVGPANGFVWGLIEVSGTFQTGGQFGLNGVHRSQLLIDPASVKTLP